MAHRNGSVDGDDLCRPLVSIIIPANDVEPYVAGCLGSILRNARQDIEVIAVDDGSRDRTPRILADLAQGDRRVQILTHRQPLGAGASRNDGLQVARGDYIWYIDADDWLLDGQLDTALARLDGQLDVLLMDHVRVWPDGAAIGGAGRMVLSRAPTRPFTMAEWPEIAKVLHMPWNKIVRRELLIRHGVQFPVGVGSDIVFTYTVLANAKSIGVERAVVYAWRTGRPGQITRTSGSQHLALSDQWRAALAACADQPIEVRSAVFARMIWHAWSVLSDPVRLRGGRVREEFFRRFVALYREEWRAGMPRNLVLASGSWPLARLRLLTRQARARMPRSVVRMRDRVRVTTIELRETTRQLSHDFVLQDQPGASSAVRDAARVG